MDEAAVTALETAIADAGALLVQADRYVEATEAIAPLGRAADQLGARARRLHRHDAFDTAAAAALVVEAEALVTAIRAVLAAVHRGETYRRAVAAHARGDQAALAELLPGVFRAVARLEVVPDIFQPMPWMRRTRARTPAELAEAVARRRDEGFAAEGDDLTPAADAALPAVPFEAEPPDDEPVVLRVPAATLAVPVFRHGASGAHLVYTPTLRVPFTVRIARALDADAAPPDWDAWRTALRTALLARGIPVDDV